MAPATTIDSDGDTTGADAVQPRGALVQSHRGQLETGHASLGEEGGRSGEERHEDDTDVHRRPSQSGQFGTGADREGHGTARAGVGPHH